MKAITKLLIFLMLFSGVTYAQECGPSCPVCSGAGAVSSEGALLSRNSFLASVLSVPSAEEERTVFNVKYGIFTWLDGGVGYAARTEKFLWNIRVQTLTEEKDGWRPGIIIGSGSVQTGGNDQSIYAQLLKSFTPGKGFGINLSVGTATLLPDVDEVYGLAGITANLFERFNLFTNYDGRSFHEGVSWNGLDRFTITFLMVETELPAVSFVIRW